MNSDLKYLVGIDPGRAEGDYSMVTISSSLWDKIMDVVKVASMIDQCQSASARRALDLHLRDALTALQTAKDELQ